MKKVKSIRESDSYLVHGKASFTARDEPDFYQFDKYSLETEWEKQPKLFWDYSVVLADRRADVERAEAEENVVYAEIEQEFRLEKIDTKVTEAAVKAAVLTDERYKRAVESRIQAKHAADMAKAAVDTLSHRKTALEKEVELFLANYFAKPRAPKGREEEVGMMRKRHLRNPEAS